MEDPLDDPLFEVPPAGPPAVHLASGPGPSPALDPDPDAAFVVDRVLGQIAMAHLAPVDPDTGRRGWELKVAHLRPPFDPDAKHHFSRHRMRPPTIAARIEALRELGFEPSERVWRWSEREEHAQDRPFVRLYATLYVRPLPRAEAADEGACPGCRGRGARVLPSSSTETECSECEGTGRIPDDERLGVQHRAAVAGLTCIPVAGSSAPTPAYGAPALPVLPPQYVDSGAHTREERN